MSWSDWIVMAGSSVSRFQMMIRSIANDASVLPSRDQATAVTGCVWPFNSRSILRAGGE